MSLRVPTGDAASFLVSVSHCRREHGNERGGRARGSDAGESYLQAAAVVDGGFQSYPRDKDPVVPVDAVTLAYVEAKGLSRSFDYLDKVDRVLGILKQRSRTDLLNS